MGLPTFVACSLALLAATASAFPVYDVEEVDLLSVNPNRGTAFTSVGRLDSGRAIQCYTDYGNNNGAGTCNILTVDGLGLSVSNAEPFVFNENHTLEVRVAPFSSSKAVVCYSDKGFSLKLICKLLDLTADSLSASQAVVVDPDADEVPHMGLASLSEDVGVLCWADPGPKDDQKDRPGVCNLLTLDGGSIEVGRRFDFDTQRSTSDISVGGFSDESAMLCWSGEGTGFCAALSLDGGAESGLGMGAKKEFFQSSEVDFAGIVVVSFTQTQGAVCYADGDESANEVGCKVLLLDGSTLTVGSQEIVSGQPAQWLTATDLTSEAALVCYATPTGDDVDVGTATCNVVGITVDNTTVGAGPPNEVNGRPTQHMALASLDMESGVLCFSDGGAGEGRCKALRMAPTTTSTTETTISTSSETTASTTSPHTTTATTTTTETSTTSFHTTTETSTTTSPHTTTATATQNRQPQEDSGSAPSAVLGVVAVSVSALSLALQ